MKKSVKILLIILISLLIVIVVGKTYMLKNLEKSMLETYPDKVSPLDSLAFKNLSFEVGDREIFASYIETDDPSKALFICMGNGETLYEWKPVQVFLYEKGFSSFVFTYSGFGNSTGKPTINNLNKDVHAAYQKFIELTPNTKERIAVSNSLGGAPLIKMINKFEPAPSKLIIYATFSSVRDILVDMDMFSSGTVWIFPDVWNSKKSLKKIDIPTYLFHSKIDSTIPVVNAHRLMEYASSGTELILLEQFEHNELYKQNFEDLWHIILDKISE